MASQGIYKVIPAGVTERGKLRATLMLSPSVSAKELRNLPSGLLRQWRQEEKMWTKELQVVKLWVTGDACVTDLKDAIEKGCDGVAASSREAWGNTDDVEWLDKLWAANLTRGWDEDEEWEVLVKLLERSNRGTAIQAGSDLRKTPPPAGAAGAASGAASGAAPAGSAASSASSTPSAQDAATTYIQAILPSRQSDLALLLESQRALEICATARWALGDYDSCHAEEESCRLTLARGGAMTPATSTGTEASDKKYVDPTDTKQAELRIEAGDRFSEAEDRVRKLYKCEPTGKPPDIATAPWLLAPAAAASGREQIAKQVPAAVRSYRDANQVEAGKPDADGKCCDIGDIAQNYFAIQGSPALSRLFGLTVDLEIETNELNSKLGLTEAQIADRNTVVLLCLGANIGGSESTSMRVFATLLSIPTHRPCSRRSSYHRKLRCLRMDQTRCL